MKQQVINQLEEMGVYLHEGGFGYDSFGAMFDSLPLVAIYADSEEPTAQEIKKLAEFVKNKAKFYFSSAVKDFKVEGANTVTFNKKNGQWNYRRLTWKQGLTWSKEKGALQQIMPKI